MAYGKGDFELFGNMWAPMVLWEGFGGRGGSHRQASTRRADPEGGVLQVGGFYVPGHLHAWRPEASADKREHAKMGGIHIS